MSQKAFLADFDASLHEAFSAAGLADHGQYTPKGGTTPVDCDVYVDRTTQEAGELGQLRAPRYEVTYVLDSMAPTAPADDGRLVVDGDTFVNVYESSNDGSLSRWVVRRVAA